ncbi:MAG: hypothetical protein HRU12_07265 [Phaeodactylibacter sp.]|nr:hypothetical protein [Phaeodactylibacter sp.]
MNVVLAKTAKVEGAKNAFTSKVRFPVGVLFAVRQVLLREAGVELVEIPMLKLYPSKARFPVGELPALPQVPL